MRYRITTTFVTDRNLTEKELIDLCDSISLQVEEPQDRQGEECDYETGDIETNVGLQFPNDSLQVLGEDELESSLIDPSQPLSYYTTCTFCDEDNDIETVLEGVGEYHEESNTIFLQPCPVCGNEMEVSGWLSEEEQDHLDDDFNLKGEN